MDITLAWPWTGPDGVTHAPDETVTVDRATAARLLRAGRARAAAPAPTPDQPVVAPVEAVEPPAVQPDDVDETPATPEPVDDPAPDVIATTPKPKRRPSSSAHDTTKEQ